jgi:long-chain acyl-CoA synthetase
MPGTLPTRTREPMHPGVHAQKTPDRPAIIMADGSGMLTFAGYEMRSNQCAHLLRQMGLQRGDGVALFMHNELDFMPLVWGAWRAGLRVTAIATHLKPAELDFILGDCGAGALIVSAALAEVVGECPHTNIADANVFVSGGTYGAMRDPKYDRFSVLEEALGAMPTTRIADESEGVEMLYSSGTTGRPKGVRKLLSELPFGMPNEQVFRAAERFGFDETTRYLSPAPLYHAAPLMFNLRIHRFGGCSVIMPKFDAAHALSLIEEHAITHSQWVPTMFVRMLRLPDAARRQHDLSSHRVAIHAAAPCPVKIKHQMIEWWGPIIEEYYGGSEGNGLTSLSSGEWLRHPGSVGRALLGDLRVCDDEGQVLAHGETGTVYFANGPQFEYHNDAKKTAASRHANGWSTLGDMGYVNDEGYLFLTDRKAFVIISGGVNIYPQEAENLLLTHPEVLDAAVFGVPNEEFGEEVKAVVQLANGVGDGATAERLMAFCREHLSAIKCPRSVDFIDAMPREANGKLYKRQLRAQYWETTAQ